MEIIGAILVGVLLLIIFQKRIKNYVIGRLGEYRIAKQLKKLNKKNYTVLNNVLLKTKRGTVEIDHIVISTKGIYVIETKNRKGIIIGCESWDYWTQKLYTKEHKFYSPVKQNNSHIEALRRILRPYPVKYYSIIVFMKNSNLKSINCLTKVINEEYLTKAINKHQGQSHLSKSDLSDIVRLINKYRVSSVVARSKHKRYVKSKAKLRKKKINKRVCPRCGSKLVTYKNKSGTGLRCSDYPNCRVVIVKSK